MVGAQITPIDLTDFSSSARVQVGFKLTRTMARFDISNIETESKFHLDFTLDVDEWDEGDNLDDYNPSGNGNVLPLSVIIPDDMKDRVDYTEDTRTVAIEAKDGFSFDVQVGNNMPLDVAKNYTGSAAAQDCDWLKISAPVEVTKAPVAGYRYTISVKSGYDKEIYPKAVFRFTDRITGNESILRVTQAPPISVIIPEDMNGKVTYTETSRTIGIEATDNYRFNVLINSKAPLTMSKEYAGGAGMQQYDWLDVSELPELTKATVEGKSYAVSVKPGYDKALCPDAIIHFTDTEAGFDNVLYVKPLPAVPVLSSPATVAHHAETNNKVSSFTITGKSVGGSKISGPNWLTYETTSSSTNLFSYTVMLDPSKSGFPTTVPGEQTIRITNSGDETKVVEVKVNFTEENAWLATDLANYDEKTSDGYRSGTNGKTMTVSFYSMFAAPSLSSSITYDNTYCTTANGGKSWLGNITHKETIVENNRRKYIYNIAVTKSSGTDAAYQLHKATINIKQNSTTVKSYIIWRGASYYGYPAGGGSPYYTAIKKNGIWWAPVNCGATRVAQPNDGKNETVAGTGNLYQWGRADYTNYGGSTASGPISNTRPNNHVFYKAPNSPNNWLNKVDNTLWNGSSKGTNDPCPKGYRVPTLNELASIGNANSYDNSGGLFKVNAENGYPQLILPAVGYRIHTDGSSYNQGSLGNYWSSTASSGPLANNVFFTTTALLTGGSPRANGFTIRCIKE